MMTRRAVTTMAVVSVLMVSLTGCAGKFKISGMKMCQATGGTYNQQAKHCTYAAQTRTAQQSCQAHGGYYDPAADVCEMGMD
jgi:hypothetical protein